VVAAELTHLYFHRIPPVIAKGYEPKGQYITLNGMKTCMDLQNIPVTHRGLHSLAQTLRDHQMLPRQSSRSTISSASSLKPSRVPTFSPSPTKSTHTRSLSQTSLMANLQIFHGTHQTRRRRERSSATSSKPKLDHHYTCQRSRTLSRKLPRATQTSPAGALSATAGVVRWPPW
jgi:hypothetical protein